MTCKSEGSHHFACDCREEKFKNLLEASKRLVYSIKWAGDINQVNLAPKISILREAITRIEK